MKTIGLILKQKGNEIWAANLDMTVFEALQLMATRDIGALPVLDSGKLVGIFSERDYARKLILKGRASKNTLIKDIMSTHLITVSPSQTNEQGLELMTAKRVRHLPVMSEDNLIGFVSIGDLVKAIISDQKQVIDKLEQHIIETTGLN